MVMSITAAAGECQRRVRIARPGGRKGGRTVCRVGTTGTAGKAAWPVVSACVSPARPAFTGFHRFFGTLAGRQTAQLLALLYFRKIGGGRGGVVTGLPGGR